MGTPVTRFGRFLVLRTLGEGGMGVVLSSYDERLDRRVAIKVLRAGAELEWRARVLREARALARLSHPNVVQVYEVGEHEGDPFIVMEHIDGQTLSQWRRAGTRSHAEVIERFVAAGQGLAAAHAVGLVHRDFKPANVLLGHDGRVCVADFGIASVDHEHPSGSHDDPSASESLLHGPVSSSSPGFQEPLTRPNEVVGTPAYMAPEQLVGEVVDGRSDQFSFCVALHEALHGQRPFFEGSLEELQRAVLSGRRRPPPPPGITVPAYVTAAIERGLQLDPSARWPGMEPLLHALTDDPRRRRRRWIKLGLGVVTLTAAAWGYRELVRGEYEHARSARAQMCTDSQAAFEAVWSEESRERMHASMLATEVPYAEAAWKGMSTQLDGYAERWQGQHAEACEATTQGVQSEAMLDLRLECLAQRRQAVAALVEELAQSDATAVQRATKAVATLPRLDACIDLVGLTGQGDHEGAGTPEDEALDEQLAHVRARYQLGSYSAGLTLAEDLLAKATALDRPRLMARARYEVGLLQYRNGDGAAARETLTTTFYEAEAAADDSLRLDAADGLIFIEGVDRHDREAGLRWGREARALVERLGASGAAKLPGTLQNIATVHGNHGEPELAQPLLEAALELRQHDPESPMVLRANTLVDLALVHASLGRSAKARDYLEAAVELLEQLQGPEHPDLVAPLINLMTIHASLGDAVTGVAVGERAAKLARRALGPGHPMLGKLFINLAGIESDLGHHDTARAYYREGLDVLERAYGRDDPSLVVALASNAAEEGQHGDLARSRTLYERALAIATASQGPTHPAVVLPLQGLANVELLEGRVGDARQHFTQAIEVQRAHPIPEELTPLLLTLGELELDDGHPERAEPLMREATELLANPQGPEAHELLGAAWLGQARVERARGRALADVEPRVREAVASFEAAGPLGAERLAELHAWWRDQGGAALD